MDRIAAFVGQPPPPSSHYTKRTIAAIHPITVESRRTPETPGPPGNENMGNIRHCECFTFPLFEKELYVDVLGVDVGTAFAFSHKYLFTTYHIIQEPDPK